MKVSAAVLRRDGRGAALRASRNRSTIEEVELDAAGPRRSARARSAAAGLCHSDLSVINGDRPRPMPMALGHEAAGIVEELGDRRHRSRRAAITSCMVFVPSCGHCPPCAEGRPALCEPGAAANAAGTLLSGARRLSNATASRSITISAARRSPNTRRSRAARRSRSIPSCRSTRRRCSAARC